MPLYDFVCKRWACDATKIEALVRKNEAVRCPKCGDDMERQLSKPAEPQFVGGSQASTSMKIRNKGDGNE